MGRFPVHLASIMEYDSRSPLNLGGNRSRDSGRLFQAGNGRPSSLIDGAAYDKPWRAGFEAGGGSSCFRSRVFDDRRYPQDLHHACPERDRPACQSLAADDAIDPFKSYPEVIADARRVVQRRSAHCPVQQRCRPSARRRIGGRSESSQSPDRRVSEPDRRVTESPFSTGRQPAVC